MSVSQIYENTFFNRHLILGFQFRLGDVPLDKKNAATKIQQGKHLITISCVDN